MHELSIAINIINLAEEAARMADAKSIHMIELEIGEFGGIDLDALEFAMDVSVKGTMLAKAKRKYTSVAGVAKCHDCNKEFSIETHFEACPACKSTRYDIIKGKELLIRSLEIDTLSANDKKAEIG